MYRTSARAVGGTSPSAVARVATEGAGVGTVLVLRFEGAGSDVEIQAYVFDVCCIKVVIPPGHNEGPLLVTRMSGRA